MCCRFYIRENDPDFAPIVEGAEKSRLFPRVQKTHPAPLVRAGEVRPTDIAAVLAMDKQQKPALFPMIWGVTTPGRKIPIINARSESAAENPLFREAWEKHRCVIPASWYIDWQHLPSEDGRSTIKTKYAIQPRDANLTYLCGLYRIENGLPVFVIVTKASSEDVSHIHDRMPLILPKKAIRHWINPEVKATELLPYAVTELVSEKAEESS